MIPVEEIKAGNYEAAAGELMLEAGASPEFVQTSAPLVRVGIEILRYVITDVMRSTGTSALSGLAAVGQEAIDAGAKAAAELGALVPMFGAVIGGIMDVTATTGWSASAGNEAQANERAYCERILVPPAPTGPGGTTRPIDYFSNASAVGRAMRLALGLLPVGAEIPHGRAFTRFRMPGIAITASGAPSPPPPGWAEDPVGHHARIVATIKASDAVDGGAMVWPLLMDRLRAVRASGLTKEQLAEEWVYSEVFSYADPEGVTRSRQKANPVRMRAWEALRLPVGSKRRAELLATLPVSDDFPVNVNTCVPKWTMAPIDALWSMIDAWENTVYPRSLTDQAKLDEAIRRALAAVSGATPGIRLAMQRHGSRALLKARLGRVRAAFAADMRLRHQRVAQQRRATAAMAMRTKAAGGGAAWQHPVLLTVLGATGAAVALWLYQRSKR